ncbi:hypothetical protein [Pseudonocardia sp. N23]|uniref:hypothetical protein n=1 Tax=Pseudonocardia sp. N23 TaxID=1987376 RepID=UPI000BFE9FEB|nr:hypothetical protein [Pseudonocardia sp. N23]GAY12027.1 hypothetical protein TOK_0417 [Pseudonocardia sp. N23]
MARHELEQDLQSLAYRDMPDEQVTTDDQIRHFLVREHEPIRSVADVTLPGQYELDGWDTGRQDPR